MKKSITRGEYEQFLFYKSRNDQLNRMSERLFNYSEKILDIHSQIDIYWLSDYFDNNMISVTELFKLLDIDIEEEKIDFDKLKKEPCDA